MPAVILPVCIEGPSHCILGMRANERQGLATLPQTRRIEMHMARRPGRPEGVVQKCRDARRHGWPKNGMDVAVYASGKKMRKFRIRILCRGSRDA